MSCRRLGKHRMFELRVVSPMIISPDCETFYERRCSGSAQTGPTHYGIMALGNLCDTSWGSVAVVRDETLLFATGYIGVVEAILLDASSWGQE